MNENIREHHARFLAARDELRAAVLKTFPVGSRVSFRRQFSQKHLSIGLVVGYRACAVDGVALCIEQDQQSASTRVPFRTIALPFLVGVVS